MAITDVDVFAHLTDADIECLASELDDIRQDMQHVEIGKIVTRRADPQEARRRIAEFLAKARRQVFKDYVAFPALTALSPGATHRSTLTANALAN